MLGVIDFVCVNALYLMLEIKNKCLLSVVYCQLYLVTSQSFYG